MKKLSTLFLAGLSFFLCAQPPNIICILTDDLGYGDLACMGAPDMATPNIDYLAEEGLTFTHFYANCPVCSPSRASLLTGKYPDLAGVPGVIRQWEDNSWGYLKEDMITLPEVLKEAGYHTGMVGKWHLGFEHPNIPNSRGFDHFKGFLGDMMDDYWSHLRGDVNWMRHNEEIIDPEGHATDIFTDWAIEYVEEQRENEEPFFLYLAYNAPHFPIQPPADYLEKVLEREKGIEEKRAANVAFIEHLDYNIGRLMDFLAKSNTLENTVIVFTSDNGGAAQYAQRNLPLNGSKQMMLEGGIRVPCFVFWDGQIPGSSTDNVGMLMDLLPTFANMAGVDVPAGIDGISLWNIFLGLNQETNDRTLFWVRREGGRYDGQAYYAARDKEYKILQNSPFEPYQFFHISKDDYEERSLEPKENMQAYMKLRRELQSHIQEAGAVPWQKMKAPKPGKPAGDGIDIPED